MFVFGVTLLVGILNTVHGQAVPSVTPTMVCPQLVAVGCGTYVKTLDDETVCGTDGKTYYNYCLYSLARCRAITKLAYVGPCTAGTPDNNPGGITTKVPPSSTLPHTTSSPFDILNHVFCKHAGDIPCEDTLMPVCGSDKQFYRNQCMYSKGRCKNPSLTEMNFSFCQPHVL